MRWEREKECQTEYNLRIHIMNDIDDLGNEDELHLNDGLADTQVLLITEFNTNMKMNTTILVILIKVKNNRTILAVLIQIKITGSYCQLPQ